MWPPIRNGSIARSSSARPQSAPIPLGPHILWPEIATKSPSSACTSTRMCGAACAASQTKIAPCSCAQRTSGARSADRAERVRDEVRRDDLHVAARARSRRAPERSTLALVVEREHPELGAVAPAMYCHGTKFEWCSSSVTTTTSPGPRLLRPHEYATRLIASVALRTKMISRTSGALMKRAHLLARALEAGGGALGEHVDARGARSRTTSRRTSSSRRAPGAASASCPPSRGTRAACRGSPARRSGNPRAARARRASSARGHSHGLMVAR